MRRARLGQIVPNFITGFQAPAQEVLLRIGELAALIALLLLALRSEESDRRGALIAGSIALSGFVLNLLLIAVGIDDLISRNVIALWVPAALVVSAGLGARRAGLIGIGATVAPCIIGIVAAIGVDVERKFQRPDWHAVAHLLGTEPAPPVGARAILIQDHRNALPLSLYLPSRGDPPSAPARLSSMTSASLRRRCSPGFSVPSSSGPKRTRSRPRTG